MTCAQTRPLLMDSLDDSLAPDERALVEAHLASCPPCVQFLKETVVTTQVLRGLGSVEEGLPVPPIPESLVQRILAARRAAIATTKKSGRRTG